MVSVTSTQGISHVGVPKVSNTCKARDLIQVTHSNYFPEYLIKCCHCINAIITSVLVWVC